MSETRLSRAELATRFADRDWITGYLPAVNRAVSARVFEGGLGAGFDVDDFGEGPYVIVVDGDLATDSDLVLDTRDNSMFVVTGSLRARNLVFDRGTLVVVERDCVAHFVIGSHGDDNAGLVVGGNLRARGVFLDGYTGIEVAGAIEAPVDARGFCLPDDFAGIDPRDAFVAEVLRNGTPDIGALRAHVLAGRDPYAAGRSPTG
ncbi:MAG TPA: hypothetical protein VLX92_20265 [Kofleriaceae bacterium]|nr:hypothetical protein [Kofleriaceae bacterium]